MSKENIMVHKFFFGFSDLIQTSTKIWACTKPVSVFYHERIHLPWCQDSAISPHGRLLSFEEKENCAVIKGKTKIVCFQLKNSCGMWSFSRKACNSVILNSLNLMTKLVIFKCLLTFKFKRNRRTSIRVKFMLHFGSRLLMKKE